MRSDEEVLAKFRDAYNRVLEARMTEYLETKSVNCQFNSRFKLKRFGLVGFCLNPKITIGEHHGAFVCHDDEVAKKCSCFVNKHTVESVRADLDEIMCNPSRCGQEYPKLAMLLWFLQSGKPEKQSRFVRLCASLKDAVRAACFIISLRWW
jgi:hypothetical protein